MSITQKCFCVGKPGVTRVDLSQWLHHSDAIVCENPQFNICVTVARAFTITASYQRFTSVETFSVKGQPFILSEISLRALCSVQPRIIPSSFALDNLGNACTTRVLPQWKNGRAGLRVTAFSVCVCAN